MTTAKKSTAKPSDVEVLAAEALHENVTVEINDLTVEVNPRAANALSAIRALQEQGNMWPLFYKLIPDKPDQEALIASLPVDEGLGEATIEDFASLVNEIMEAVGAGK